MSKQKKFEENLAELETIVQSLENGEIALEDAITAFQKGMVLSKSSKLRWTRLKRPWSRSCKKTEQKVILNEKARKISSCRVGFGRFLWRPAVCL